MAGHVLANAHIRFGRRRQMKMGIKTGDAVQAIQRHVYFLRKALQLIGRQIAELTLNVPQLIENQRRDFLTGEIIHSQLRKQLSSLERCSVRGH